MYYRNTMIVAFIIVVLFCCASLFIGLPLSALASLMIGCAGMIGLRMDWVDWRKNNV